MTFGIYRVLGAFLCIVSKFGINHSPQDVRDEINETQLVSNMDYIVFRFVLSILFFVPATWLWWKFPRFYAWMSILVIPAHLYWIVEGFSHIDDMGRWLGVYGLVCLVAYICSLICLFNHISDPVDWKSFLKSQATVAMFGFGICFLMLLALPGILEEKARKANVESAYRNVSHHPADTTTTNTKSLICDRHDNSVLECQQALIEANYDLGYKGADGSWGAKSHAALIRCINKGECEKPGFLQYQL